MTIQITIITLVGAIISGVLATVISLWVNRKNEEKRLKREVAADIFGYRFLLNKPVAEKFYAVLNRVPIIFASDKKVIHWYDELHSASLIKNPEERARKMDDALVSFLKEICKASGINSDNWNDSKVKDVFG